MIKFICDSVLSCGVVVVAVKDVVLQLKPMLSQNKLLVSVVAGVKLKDLQVYAYSFAC